MPRKSIRLELMPHERAALLKWKFGSSLRDQLKACASSDGIESFTISRVALHWLASDLTHAIVKQACSDNDVIELSERLDYVDETGDGSLAGWY